MYFYLFVFPITCVCCKLWVGFTSWANMKQTDLSGSRRQECVHSECCLTPWNQPFCSESSEGLEAGQRRSGRQRALLMWAGQSWGQLRRTLSHFIDIQGFDLLTTGTALRLRQHIVLHQRAKGSPRASSLVCVVVMVSVWVRQHHVTLVGTFCLSSSLSFFPLTFSPAVSQRGVFKKSFVNADSAWVCHGHLSSTCTVTKEGKNWKWKDFYSQNAQKDFHYAVGAESESIHMAAQTDVRVLGTHIVILQEGWTTAVMSNEKYICDTCIISPRVCCIFTLLYHPVQKCGGRW